MKLNDRDKGIILLGVVFVAFGGYVSIRATTRAGNPSGLAPASEGRGRQIASADLNVSTQSLSGEANVLGIDAKGGLTMESTLLHFFHPDGPMSPTNPPNQSYVYLKHRYPNVTGTNINTLIHKGYSPLMVPAPQDYDWMVNPPSEQML